VSLIKTNRTTSGAAELGARAKDRAIDVAAQAIPVGKRAGTTAVQGVRQGVHDAKEWAAPRLEDAVQGARDWVAPRIEEAAEAVTTTVAPKVSSALLSTARQVRPGGTKRTGIRRLLNWRWLLGAGAVIAAAGTGAAVAMRRRYASATAEAKNATESPEEQAGEHGGDAAMRSEVNGRVTTPGT
jgi:hypothetical protein